MKIMCFGRETEELRAFEVNCLRPPRMLAIPELVNGAQRLREFELLRDAEDAAYYLETPESAERTRLAA